ncbi:MAG: tRNA pseudouridine(55) synthase TruB [Clostridia bacterium]|nr:tRNA pseudouridine(55) synthase TruB [Clostridia bacterium]
MGEKVKLGFININKESGVSSGYVVNKIKRLTGMPCGHMGTLDPLASGVLPVAIGNAARLFDYMLQKKKQYIAVFRFGVTSDTLDSTGEVITDNPYIPSEKELKEATHALIGEVMQLPPKYSAKSVNGKRGYQLAREGKDFELQPKKVLIEKIELLDRVSEDSFRFLVDCGGGTYIRSIARDLAFNCGAQGIMTSLLRTKSGAFCLENAVTLEELTAENIENYVIDTDSVLKELPRITIQNYHIFHGLPQRTEEKDGLYKIYDENGLYGLVEVKGGMAKIKTKLC